ncbi:glutathione S-transferase Ure2-like protein [Mollisia scopiformis]|uniref:Glutathione S-transferase Ure2-like protein n=1 Tax=Mollisia scopiformis TaxID=149040 RepID=A0A132B3Y7_MOLSC|nr:glutathione S-transferase Ure2-like protein [Mollisia scopiformis]KUJ06634.1 glutathione S-transferase Ure2-like protein [Mollisia scopiformis]
MSSEIKPITVWGKGGPNPPKVAILLGELGLPVEFIIVPLSKVKEPEFLAINPNGRIPAIHDPNTDLTLWESGAIIEYLIERYDTEHKFSFPAGTPEAYHAKQWLFFAASGQGPYYGQLGWFKLYHEEKIPSAIERYVKEVNRVTGVLDGHLAKQKVGPDSDGPWLVGDKYSFADMVFVSWQKIISLVTTKEEYSLDAYPHVKEWHGKMMERGPVKEAMAAGKPAQ